MLRPGFLASRLAGAIIGYTSSFCTSMSSEKPGSHRLKAVPKTVSGPNESATNECQKCYATGMEIVPGKGARVCDCRQLKPRDHKWDSVRLPPTYDGFHFHNYTP